MLPLLLERLFYIPSGGTEPATVSTSEVAMSPNHQSQTLYLVEEDEMKHCQKRRQLELELLHEQIEA